MHAVKVSPPELKQSPMLGFGNRSISVHLLRGVIGLVAVSVAWIAQSLWLAAVLVPLTLFAWKGCPTCWTIGLVQTVVRRIRS